MAKLRNSLTLHSSTVRSQEREVVVAPPKGIVEAVLLRAPPRDD